jgi:peptidyl-prolyl cis-trans isomerase B (cyclophilin B)
MLHRFLTPFFLLLAASVGFQSASFAQSRSIVMETDSGTIVFMLTDNTPLHRDNMLKLVRQGLFDSLLFHRVIPGFVVQGGDPNSKRAPAGIGLGDGDLGYKVPAEINDSNFHRRGAVGMARDENPQKESSASQFYFVTGRKFPGAEIERAARPPRVLAPSQKAVYQTEGGTPMLDGGYTVFGYVVTGMDVIDRISAMPRDPADRPTTDIRIRRAYVLGEGKPAKAGKEAKSRKRKRRFLIF